MSKRFFIQLAVVTVALLAQTETSYSVIKAQQMFIPPFFQNYGTSWITGPEKYHYQFHLSEQSWNMAREYCLALASDLVVIKSLQQIEWIISRYPLSNSATPERIIQIGLVLVDKENSTEKEWKWVDNTPLNTTFLEWDMLVWNTTEKVQDRTENGRCALLSIDNRKLKTISCDQKPNFDYTNRFICQRSNEQHQQHEKENNPFYGFIVQLMSKLRNDTLAKPKQQTTQSQEMKTQTKNVQENIKDLSTISRKTENNEDQLSKAQKFIAKTPLTTIDPDIGKTDRVNFTTKQKVKENKEREAKNETVNGNKHKLRAKTFAAKGKTIVRIKNIKNNEKMLHSLKRNFPQFSKLCGQNGAASKDSKTWYEQFGDIFRNLNLFLKQEKSSDLRMLLDDNNTNKTLVERLKEAIHARNNTGLSNQQHFDHSIHKVSDSSSILAHDTADKINRVLLIKKRIATAPQTTEGRTVATDHKYDTTIPSTIRTHGKEELAQRSEVNEDGIYEILGETLQNMLTKRLRNLSDQDGNITDKSNEINKKIKSNMSEEQLNRNEVNYNKMNEQRTGVSLLPSANQKKNIIKYATGVPHAPINDSDSTQQTTKQSAVSSNLTETSFEMLNGNITLHEKHKTDKNESNMKIAIVNAIHNMKNCLDNAGQEIKRVFTYLQKWL